VLERFEGLEIGVHLHSRPDDAAAKVVAAYDAGCRRFDSAIGGLGGCPFAQDVLVGNIPTEKLLEALRGHGAQLPALKSISDLLRMSAEISSKFSGPKM
jgi:hydroxymethylglutaryl-CoA lyase